MQIAAYYPPHLGGLERVVQEVAKQLAADDYNVTVLTSRIGRENEAAIQRNGLLKIVSLRGAEFAHTPFLPGLFWQLWRVPKPAVFHLHLAQAFLPEVTWLAAKLRRIPFVVHFHLDVEPSGPLGFLFVLYKKTVQKMVVRGADAVIVLSPEQKDMIIERYKKPPPTVTFMPNGVSQDFLKIGTKKRTRHTPLRLLFVGRLAVQKRVDRLLKAVAKLDIPVHLTIAGDGEDRQKLIGLVRELKLKNVTFAGTLFDKELKRAYKEVDVLVLPSDREGMPLAMLEAMACGLPVIGSDVQGIREHLAGVGVLVPKPSPRTFADAIVSFTLLDDTSYVTMSTDCHLKAREYGWPGLTEKIEKLYQNL